MALDRRGNFTALRPLAQAGEEAQTVPILRLGVQPLEVILELEAVLQPLQGCARHWVYIHRIIRIQRIWRGCKSRARQRVRWLAARTLQRQWRFILAFRKVKVFKAAALVIQAHARVLIARSRTRWRR